MISLQLLFKIKKEKEITVCCLSKKPYDLDCNEPWTVFDHTQKEWMHYNIYANGVI